MHSTAAPHQSTLCPYALLGRRCTGITCRITMAFNHMVCPPMAATWSWSSDRNRRGTLPLPRWRTTIDLWRDERLNTDRPRKWQPHLHAWGAHHPVAGKGAADRWHACCRQPTCMASFSTSYSTNPTQSPEPPETGGKRRQPWQRPQPQARMRGGRGTPRLRPTRPA